MTQFEKTYAMAKDALYALRLSVKFFREDAMNLPNKELMQHASDIAYALERNRQLEEVALCIQTQSKPENATE